MSLFITLQLPWSQSWLCLLIYILYPETEAKHHNLTGLLNAAPLLSFSTLKINKNARIGLEIRHISKECFPAMAAKLENSLILRHLQLYRYTPSTDVYKSTLFRFQHLLSVLQSFTQKYLGVWNNFLTFLDVWNNFLTLQTQVTVLTVKSLGTIKHL